MICAGCKRELEVGDRYIKFTQTEWAEREGLKPLNGMDDIFAAIMGSGLGENMVFCEDCTTESSDGWMQDSVYGDEVETEFDNITGRMRPRFDERKLADGR